MLVLKVTYTPDEVAEFFRSNGFTVEDREFGYWDKHYHNKCEWVTVHEPAVVLPDGKYVKAKKLFEKVTEWRIKRMIAPTNLETQRSIEKNIKHLLK